MINEHAEHPLKESEDNLSFLKRNLADFLTFSRAIIGFIILYLSFTGPRAYLTAVVLTLVGAATDLLDGKVARHFLGENREGKLGKHDHEIDTFFVLCALGYLSFSGIVVSRLLGFGWIVLVILSYFLSGRDLRVQIISEVATVVALLVIALIYDPLIFWLLIAPAMAAGILINRKRVLYLVFEYWPPLFSK